MNDSSLVNVEVAGEELQLEIRRFGPPDVLPRIVLLHQGLGSVAAWKTFPSVLADQLCEPVLAYSRPGHGESSVTGRGRDANFMHHEATVVLPALLEALRIEKPLLIGHSEGASIALIYASAASALVQQPLNLPSRPVLGVAAIAPHLFVERSTVEEIRRLKMSLVDNGLLRRLARYHKDAKIPFKNWSDIWTEEEFRHWSIESEVATVSAPLLAIQGVDDQFGTVRQIERLVQLRPHTKALMLPACRHNPHEEQPAVVLAALTGFVAGLSH
jgi:pimeloyl-ACP methyl ester carboxylesterase